MSEHTGELFWCLLSSGSLTGIFKEKKELDIFQSMMNYENPTVGTIRTILDGKVTAEWRLGLRKMHEYIALDIPRQEILGDYYSKEEEEEESCRHENVTQDETATQCDGCVPVFICDDCGESLHLDDIVEARTK